MKQLKSYRCPIQTDTVQLYNTQHSAKKSGHTEFRDVGTPACSVRHMRQAYGAIAAGRSAHDIANQVAMIRETDKTAGHVVVSNSPVERESHSHHAMKWRIRKEQCQTAGKRAVPNCRQKSSAKLQAKEHSQQQAKKARAQ